jgi:hypothetical protein
MGGCRVITAGRSADVPAVMGWSADVPRELDASRAIAPERRPDALSRSELVVEAAEITHGLRGAQGRLLHPARTLYRQVMSPTDRDHLVGNIVCHLSRP